MYTNQKITHWRSLFGAIAVITGLITSKATFAQVSMTRAETTYSQDFDTLPASGTGTWESGSYTVIPHWTVQRTNSVSTIVASNGSNNAGGLLSYGATGSTERALGSISSANAGEFAYGLLLRNDTDTTISALEVSYYGEQWRISNKTAPEHQISFWYAISPDSTSFKLSPASDEGWTEVPDLAFKSPFFKVEGGKLDGNAPANRRLLAAVFEVDVPEGHYVMLRWKDANESEADHGLAIDDVSLSWYIKPPVLLPVELVHFTAKPLEKSVHLAWETASEDRNAHFAVERSSDGFAFYSIGRVAGKGTTSQTSVYTFTDANPLSGTSYYRLKQVDEDSSYTYSHVVPVQLQERQASFTVYPTLTAGLLQVEAPQGQNAFHVAVYDLGGRQVWQQQLLSAESICTLDVSSLQPGSYVLVLLDEQGQKYVSRFVKR